ncbi:PQQ-binding-like beta-propeller repeat protein [Alienimonas californiensis]|uniref:Outer membrane protein assembly factor BamB n=1 Tax=Alienimonas californiensis TaxID=2527989 RepID=A0A517P687_9PLAN|nr:PQQ-binding-like beta-propeller repeat protein [Alienimonas californiensis]QDT14866.1 Outer membrane protein assembly factor BamB precursor [Alienimonas californiensis]
MPRSRLAPALASVCLLGLTASPGAAAEGEEWSQWRGPGRAGAIPLPADAPALRTDAPADGLKPAWIAKIEGASGGWASPVVADGRVFLAVAGRVKREGVELPPPKYPPLPEGEDDDLPAGELDEYERNRRAESLERRKLEYTGREVVHCFDAATGETLWTNERDAAVTRFPQSSTPAVAGDKLVCLGGDRVLRALDVKTGEKVWETTLPGEVDGEQISSSPAILEDGDGGGTIVLLADGLYGVDLADGALLWENAELGGRDSSPALWDGLAIVNVDGGATVAVNLADGEEAWRLEETGASRSSPVVTTTAADEPRLLTFGGSRKGGLRCFALNGAEEPELLWAYQQLSDPGASPVVAGDLVLAPGDRRLDCVSLEDGSGLWTARLDLAKPRYTSPAAVVTGDGGVGLYTFGRLLAFDLTAEEFRPRYDLSVGPEGLAKTEDQWREELNVSPGDPEGVAKYDRVITRAGLLDCASPAVAEGRVYLRLRNHLVCYDLTK